MNEKSIELELEQLIDEYYSYKNEPYNENDFEFIQYLRTRIDKIMLKYPTLKREIKDVKLRKGRNKKRDIIIIILIMIFLFCWMIVSYYLNINN